MTGPLKSLSAAAMVAGVSCSPKSDPEVWEVTETEIPLYHSTAPDPATGNLFHVEYVAAELQQGTEVFHVVYRPIDYPDRNPGFGPGDQVRVSGLRSAEDFGAMDSPDFWITDLEISRE